MPEVFSRRGQLGVKLVLLAVTVVVAAVLLVWASKTAAFASTGEPPTQPIPFSHKHHVGDVGIDCRYCHASVETQAVAGLPATQTCLTCHSQLYVDAPLLAPLHQSQARNRPIAWVQLHKLPDFSYFNHSVHVTKGVACVECHGRVDQMPLEWRTAPLLMEWCLDCHRDPRAHLRPPEQAYQMPPPPVDPVYAAHVSLQGRQRLTDCSTCHR